MANITWEVKNAEAVNQYMIEGTPTDGVIRKASLKVTAVSGENTFTAPHLEVTLGEPNLNNFTPVESVTKEDVLEWALAAMTLKRKNAIEAFITNKVEVVISQPYNVF